MTAASPPFRPVLRLVYPPGYPAAPSQSLSSDDGLYDEPRVEIAPVPAKREIRAASREVAAENRRAATVTPDEARRILAIRISELLQGGRAAILTPEHRARALRISRLLGVRDFDAHLVIALVQDRARRGEISVAQGVPESVSQAQSPDSSRIGKRTAFRMPALPDANGAVLALQFAAAVLLAAALLLGLHAWMS